MGLPGLPCQNPVRGSEEIFLEDFFDVTSSSPSLAAAMSAPSERRELQAKLGERSISLTDAKASAYGSRGHAEQFQY